MYIVFSLSETMDINTKLFIAPEKLRMITMQRTSAFTVAAVISESEGNRKKRYV